jgi:hypothetical protein
MTPKPLEQSNIMPHRSGPLLDPVAADAFIAGYKRVLLRVAGNTREGRDVLETLVRARHRAAENAALLDQAFNAETTPPVDPAVCRAIRTLRIDDYVYLKDTKDYAIFIQASGNSAFGVVGLTERIRDIVGASGVMIETGLVRYRGRFVCDGLVSRLVYLGPGYRKNYGAVYRDLRTQGRFQVECEA